MQTRREVDLQPPERADVRENVAFILLDLGRTGEAFDELARAAEIRHGLGSTPQASGLPPDQIYAPIYYVLAGLLVIGLIANILVRPVNPKWHMSEKEMHDLHVKLHESDEPSQSGSFGIGKGGLDAKALPFWLLVGVPLAWGVWKTVQKAIVLFM